MTSSAMRAPTQTPKADAALLFCSALVIFANTWIARDVSRALEATSIGEFRPMLLSGPIAASVCLCFAVGWFAHAATRRYRLMWLSALCLAALGWPISCACSTVLTTPIGGFGHCGIASPAHALA